MVLARATVGAMNARLVWVTAATAVALACGCKSKEAKQEANEAKQEANEVGANEVKRTVATEATATEAKPTTIGADQMGTYTCKDIQEDVCVGPTDRFETTAPVVHVTYKTKDLPKNGDVYSFEWIAEDVGAAAPPNTVIATLDKEVKDVAAGLKNYVVNGRLTRPTKGWPVGAYRVEIEHQGKTVTTARFTIADREVVPAVDAATPSAH